MKSMSPPTPFIVAASLATGLAIGFVAGHSAWHSAPCKNALFFSKTKIVE